MRSWIHRHPNVAVIFCLFGAFVSLYGLFRSPGFDLRTLLGVVALFWWSYWMMVWWDRT